VIGQNTFFERMPRIVESLCLEELARRRQKPALAHAPK
jgi:hypothetical protein